MLTSIICTQDDDQIEEEAGASKSTHISASAVEQEMIELAIEATNNLIKAARRLASNSRSRPFYSSLVVVLDDIAQSLASSSFVNMPTAESRIRALLQNYEIICQVRIAQKIHVHIESSSF